MSLCTRNRWGSGSGNNSSYSPKTNEAKDMEDKLKKMMADRAKQDNIWTQPNLINSNNTAAQGK